MATLRNCISFAFIVPAFTGGCVVLGARALALIVEHL